MWRLVYYRDARGRSPVKEYIASLDGDERRKVTDDFDLLEEFGVGLGTSQARNIDRKIWELRTTGRMQHRVLYFAVSGQRFVLLHAFTKKTPTTPAADKETARRRMADYLERGQTAGDQREKERERHER